MTPDTVTTILLLLVMFLAVELYGHKQRDKRQTSVRLALTAFGGASSGGAVPHHS